MKIIFSMLVLLASLFLQTCSISYVDFDRSEDHYLSKEFFNKDWRKQGVGEEEWYYRLTVIDAPANTNALGVAEGHWLHPESIRWEITKEMLIGWKPHASVLGSEQENDNQIAKHYKGAPIVAFKIISHLDIVENPFKPWHERAYFQVDWSNNVVSTLKRNDISEGAPSSEITNAATYMIDNHWVANPKRPRFSENYFEISTRHPLEVSKHAVRGALGAAFIDDTASPVIDIRHSFLKKKESDFIPLVYPDEVTLLDEDFNPIKNDKNEYKTLAIDKRFGFFRTNYMGRPIYNEYLGSTHVDSIINATIFNIWEKSIDDNGFVIPMELRKPRPIIYYMNVMHPQDLMKVSFRAAKEWDQALKEAVFYAQPDRYKSVEDVPSMWILKKNDCEVTNINYWLTKKVPYLKDQLEKIAKVHLIDIEQKIFTANDLTKPMSFTSRHNLEAQAKHNLEQICSALEYYTRNNEQKFIYQRTGDLRFNILNLEVENITTKWSGYGPMLSDSLTGEIISATANVNLKYIDKHAHQISKQIELLKFRIPSIKMAINNEINNKKISEESIKSMRFKDSQFLSASIPSSSPAIDVKNIHGLSSEERKNLLQVEVPKTSLKGLASHADISMLMDPIKFVDDISLGVALKFVKLSEEERYLKLRELIYEGVILHEIGHNMGLRHNMASSSDALNYGDSFWWIEQLPSDINAAKNLVNDQKIIEQLEECLNEYSQPKYFFTMIDEEVPTTQDCLEQKNAMYASIMDYHPSVEVHSLGKYDKAAIKWAYGQVIEVFNKENLLIDLNKVDVSRWLFLNDYRDIPTKLLKNTEAIKNRAYLKVAWDNFSSLDDINSNAVPYAFCDDPSGSLSPRCLAFDFGPNMQTSAHWLKSQYWKNYLFTHFAESESADSTGFSRDIDVLNRLTGIMRWYYYYLKTDSEFVGSYAEKDYLEAVVTGLNHFAHVIGHPSPGDHISAPTWFIEEEKPLILNSKRLDPLNIMIPFNNFNGCDASTLTKVNSAGKIEGRNAYQFIEVPLGMGRPLHGGQSRHVEDNFASYLGSSLIKKYALYLLLAPMASHREASEVEAQELLVSWYSLFPKPISKIFSSVITKNYQDLGPLFENGTLINRDIISKETFEPIIKNGLTTIMPAMNDSMATFALMNAIVNMPKTNIEEINFNKAIKISCSDCGDDIDYYPTDNETEEVIYTHLSGQSYKAVKIPQLDSIGALLLNQANEQKQKFLRLSECINNPEARTNDPLCACIKTSQRKSFDEWVCCDEDNEDCPTPVLEKVGGVMCSMHDLEIRLLKIKDKLNALVGFIDELRRLVKKSDSLS